MSIQPISKISSQVAFIGHYAIAPMKMISSWALLIFKTCFETVRTQTYRTHQIITRYPFICSAVILSLAAALLYRRFARVENAAPIALGVGAVISAHVRISDCCDGGPIRSDQKYDFSSRLRLEDGSLYRGEPRDTYLPLEAPSHVDLKGLDTAADGTPGAYIWLPASLFVGRNNGDIVRFIWDGKTVELKCAAKPGVSFAQQLNSTRFWASKKASQWDMDVPNQIKFHGIPVGENMCMLSPHLTQLKDLSTYALDEQLRAYQNTPSPVTFTDEGLCFDPTFTRMPLEDIHLIECTNFAGQKTLIVIVPHKPEKMNETFYYHGWYAIFPELPSLDKAPFLRRETDGYLHLVYK